MPDHAQVRLNRPLNLLVVGSIPTRTTISIKHFVIRASAKPDSTDKHLRGPSNDRQFVNARFWVRGEPRPRRVFPEAIGTTIRALLVCGYNVLSWDDFVATHGF